MTFCNDNARVYRARKVDMDSKKTPEECSGTTHGSTSSIDVGRTKPSGRVFIGVSESQTEKIRSAIRGERKIAVDFNDDDVVWLIYALAKELGPEAASLIGDNLGKCEFCCSCGSAPNRIELIEGAAMAFCRECGET